MKDGNNQTPKHIEIVWQTWMNCYFHMERSLQAGEVGMAKQLKGLMDDTEEIIEILHDRLKKEENR